MLLRLCLCGGGTGGLCWGQMSLGSWCLVQRIEHTYTVNGEQNLFFPEAMREYRPNTLREVSLGEHSPAPGYHLGFSLMVQEKEELVAKG